ncbi:cupin domain-containing protein [Okibacterium endophyticum]
MTSLEPFVPNDARRLDVPVEKVDADQVVAGGPRTGSSPLAVLGGVEIGVWEMTAGGMRDIESDEVFVVIDGAAVVTLENPGHAAQTIDLHPGVVCRLTAGMSTRWDVSRALRKIYILPTHEENA